MDVPLAQLCTILSAHAHGSTQSAVQWYLVQTPFQEAVVECQEACQLGLEAAELAEEEERLGYLVREKEGENCQPMLPLQ